MATNRRGFLTTGLLVTAGCGTAAAGGAASSSADDGAGGSTASSGAGGNAGRGGAAGSASACPKPEPAPAVDCPAPEAIPCPSAGPPHPKSTVITGFEFTGPPSRYPGSGSDMHWCGWAEDDALYAVDGDGANFGGPNHFAHCLRITGKPPNHKVEEVSQFPGLHRYSVRGMRYTCGTLAVGRRLYVCAYDYDYDWPGRPRYGLSGDRPLPMGPEAALVDSTSRMAGVAGIMSSDDGGKTWQNVPDASTPRFFGPRFGCPSFVQFGPGYTQLPAWLDGYVYCVSNDESWETGNHVWLARAPKDKVQDRSAWQFFASPGATSTQSNWVAEEERANPILSYHGHVGHPTVTYVRGLERFLLATFSDRVPHSIATPLAVAQKTWHRARELCLFESASPWGPWSLVHYEPFWEGTHVAYLPHLPSKWFSDDGKEGWLLFSGDYSHFSGYRNSESFYAFMTRPFRLKVAGG